MLNIFINAMIVTLVKRNYNDMKLVAKTRYFKKTFEINILVDFTRIQNN